MDSQAATRDNIELLSGYHIACFYKSKKSHDAIIKEFISLAQQKDIQITHIQSTVHKRKQSPSPKKSQKTTSYLQVYYPRISSSDIKQILNREYAKSQKRGCTNPGIILELPDLNGESNLDTAVAYEQKIDQFIRETNCPVLCMYNQNQYTTKTLLYIFRFHPYIIINNRLIKNSNHILPEHMLDQTKFFDLELQNWTKTLHEKQCAEQLLSREKSLLENTISMNPGSVSIYDSDGYFMMCNQSFRDLFGSEPKKNYSIFHDPVFNRDPIHNTLLSDLKEGKSIKAPHYMWYNPSQVNPEFPDKDILIRGIALPIQDKTGEIDKIIVFHEDITEQENQKLELLKSQTQYEFIFNEASDGIAYTDEKGVILDANPALLAITGIRREELIGRDPKRIVKKYLAPKEARRVLKQMEYFQCNDPQKMIDTFTIEYQDKIFELKGPLKRNYEKSPQNRTILLRDITEQRLIEKNLSSNNKNLDRLIKVKTEDLSRLNEQMKTEIAERIAAEEKLKAYIHDLKFLGEMALQFLDASGQNNSYEFIAAKMKALTQAPLVMIFKFDKKKQTFTCENIVGIDQKIQDVLQLCGQDLLKIRIPYDELMEKSNFSPSLNKFKGGLYELSGQIIPKNICITIEKMLGIKQLHMLGLAWKDEPYGLIAVLSRKRAEYIKNPEILETFIRMASLALKQQYVMEDLNQACNSAEQLVADRTQALLHANLNLQIEINRRKKNESKIRASLREKDELLREVHHRVKNNLQIIISLLNMQSRYIENDDIRAILAEYRNRIYSIAMIHESFYKSNDFSEIDLKKYIQSLTRHLLKYYPGNPRDMQIRIKTAKYPVPLHLAIPCGIVFNEILTHSIRFGFPLHLNRKPRIDITITIENKILDIVIRDNGIGIADEVDLNNPKMLGFELVNILIKNQLNGTIDAHNNNGTVFHIRFDLNQ